MEKKRLKKVFLFSLLSFFCATFVLVYATIERTMTIKTEVLVLSENETGCLFWDITNDGFCDDEANIEECNYDYGDCCNFENDFTFCQDCICKTNFNATQNCSSVGQHEAYAGDGICDLVNNNVANFFDHGDCCFEDQICQMQTIQISWRGVPKIETHEIDCPDNICVKSDNYCIEDQIGDGICQDHNNSPFCDYDQGDCCLPFRVLDFCCDCICRQLDCYPGIKGCQPDLSIEEIVSILSDHIYGE